MISGATYTLPLNIRYPLNNTEKMIITLKNEATGIKRVKHYPNDQETWLMSDGRIGVRLSQQDTIDLVGCIKIETQINLKSGAVAKTETGKAYISQTLNTEIVSGAMDDGETYLDGVSLEIGDPVTALEVYAEDVKAVHYTSEERTDEEKAQARENIGALDAEGAKTVIEESKDAVMLGHYHGTKLTAHEDVTLKKKVYAGDDMIALSGPMFAGYLMAGEIIKIGSEHFMVLEDTVKAASGSIENIKIKPQIAAETAAGTSVEFLGAAIYI